MGTKYNFQELHGTWSVYITQVWQDGIQGFKKNSHWNMY